MSKNSNAILTRSDPEHSHVNEKTHCQNITTYTVSVKLFLILIRDVYLWIFFSNCLGRRRKVHTVIDKSEEKLA